MVHPTGFGAETSRPLILLNASHSVVGGGLTYLQGILPGLGRCPVFRWHLLAPAPTLRVLEVPAGWAVTATPPLGFLSLHLWEQLVLPWWARSKGVAAMLCNANYVPLAAPRPLPILHSPTLQGCAQATTLRESIYWRTLNAMTELSLWRSSHAIAIADVAVNDYRAARSLRKQNRLFYAPPGRPPIPGPIAKDSDLIVAAGNILPTKRYDVLIRAMRLVTERRPNTRLEIIGQPFDSLLLKNLLRLIADMGLERSVSLLRFMSHDQLMVRICQASILASASVAEVVNLVALEAMTVGTPVVLADTRAQRDLVNSAGLFVAEGRNAVESYADAVLDLLGNPNRREAMARAGQRRAEQFDWSLTTAAINRALRVATDACANAPGDHAKTMLD